MNDLIDRQKAIETLKEYEVVESDNFTRMDSLSMMTVATIANCIEAIEELPSAEPELEEHEWCHDCKEYDQEKHCCHRWTKVIRNTVEEIKTKYWRWIPVTEALPEEKGEYLVSYHPCHWNTVSEKVLVGMDTFRGKTTWAKKKYQKVIAWMPLPEPYKVTDENSSKNN